MLTSTRRLACLSAALPVISLLAVMAVPPGCGGGRPFTPASRKLPSFSLDERSGVSHPDQIVTFDLPRGARTRDAHVVDGDDAPVPFQFIDNGRRLAVRSDLPAGASRRWSLRQGSVEAAFEGVLQVTEGDDFIEIAGDRLAVRLPNFPVPEAVVGHRWSAAPARPYLDLYNYGPDSASQPRQVVPAPVQGVRLADGAWSGLGPNMLVVLAERTTSASVRFLERGPLRVVVRIDYRFDKPEYRYGPMKISDAGPGYYTCTLTVEAGQPSILFEEDTDLEMAWGMNLYAGLEPDQARYRGHHARSVQSGRGPDGERYRGHHQQGDATVDLQYDRPQLPSYITTENSWRFLSVWDPWAFDTGWYWQAFNAEASDAANLVGVFAGRASRAIGAAMGGAGVFTLPNDPNAPEGSPVFGVAVQSYRRGPDNRIFPRSRFQWGLYLASKADLPPASEIQPINRQMNLHGGFNLDKIARYTLDLPEPADGFGGLYMPREALDRMIEKLRADGSGPHGRGFHTYLYNADPTIRPLIDMWVDESGEKTRQQARHVADEAGRILDAFVNDGGIYNFGIHYWHGGLAMSRLTVWIDQVLAGDALDDELRAQVKAAAALFGYILWDDDFVPLHGGHALNLGTANMPVQQTGYRHQYALLLARHPDFRDRAAGVAEAALRDVHATINEHGAHMGSSHYLGASMGPLLNTLVQLKRAGIYNAFADEPRLRRFAEFYMQFATPPDPRYDNLRIRIPTGNAEANNPQFLAGVLGTAFADVDPELSARLMGSWAQSGKPHTGFHVSTLLMTDEALPQADPALGSATFPGYFSVLRSGWGEPHEAAAWLVGDRWYRDHRNHGEHGMVSLYAHAAPLALNWGPMYSPYAPNALLRNTLLPADSDWKAVPAPHEGGPGDWSTSALDAFVPAADGGMAQCAASGFGSTWTRRVHLRQAGQGRPVFLIDDRFATVPLVFSLAMACEDVVRTPQGERKPGEGFILPAGVSRLDFTGQPLDKHPDGGIDWCLFVAAATPQEAFLSEWAHRNRRGQRQVILRLLGKDNFRVAIVPWPKGRSPQSIAVHRHEDGLAVEVDGQTVRFE